MRFGIGGGGRIARGGVSVGRGGVRGGVGVGPFSVGSGGGGDGDDELAEGLLLIAFACIAIAGILILAVGMLALAAICVGFLVGPILYGLVLDSASKIRRNVGTLFLCTAGVFLYRWAISMPYKSDELWSVFRHFTVLSLAVGCVFARPTVWLSWNGKRLRWGLGRVLVHLFRSPFFQICSILLGVLAWGVVLLDIHHYQVSDAYNVETDSYDVPWWVNWYDYPRALSVIHWISGFLPVLFLSIGFSLRTKNLLEHASPEWMEHCFGKAEYAEMLAEHEP